ncbi:unnamed protein product [Aureobasidium uvarum]|uniref:Uncharacterized protein n=1 Tax=Aureobasidium uvarum TaxID=2773716 RepID=A0A9N8PQY5_9PEZI|nr:unnamed protein product [Aureobasidium uvarum]
MNNLDQISQDHNSTTADCDIDEWDEDCLVYALFCFEDMPLEMIEDVLEGSANEEHEISIG